MTRKIRLGIFRIYGFVLACLSSIIYKINRQIFEDKIESLSDEFLEGIYGQPIYPKRLYNGKWSRYDAHNHFVEAENGHLFTKGNYTIDEYGDIEP